MLGDEERDASLTYTLLILWHHIITHDLNVTTIALLEELTHDMRLGVEDDTVVDTWVCSKELLKDSIVVFLLIVKRKVYFDNLGIGEVVNHIMTETSLTVSLLL